MGTYLLMLLGIKKEEHRQQSSSAFKISFRQRNEMTHIVGSYSIDVALVGTSTMMSVRVRKMR